MGKMSEASYDIRYLDEMASKKSPIHSLHPLVKLLTTMAFAFTVVSFDKYYIAGLLPMTIYVAVLFVLSEVPFAESMKKLRVVLPLVCFAALFNPFFDRVPMLQIGELTLTGGVVSGLTLIIKCFLTVIAAYLLIATTGIMDICDALRMLHIPEMIVTQIMLTFRYITVLLSEADRISESYALRAPGQKGIHFRVWGTLTGQLLLRSIDRADALYDSMLMRGFGGHLNRKKMAGPRKTDWAYLIIWCIFFVVVRYSGVLGIIGDVFL